MDQPELQRIVLQVISSSASDRRLGRGHHYLAKAVNHAAGGAASLSARDIQQAIWGLIARGLAFLDMEQSAPENWSLELTTAGRAALKDEVYNPDDPSGYLKRLYEDVSGLTPVTRLYVEEAVNSYYRQLHIASTVMLGVAAEAMFLDVATSFAAWMGSKSGDNLADRLANPKVTYIRKFDEFRKRVTTESPNLPAHIKDGLDLQLGSVLDLLRVNRNDAGHPTGVKIERDDCFVNLRLFARLAHRMYDLKEFCESGT